MKIQHIRCELRRLCTRAAILFIYLLPWNICAERGSVMQLLFTPHSALFLFHTTSKFQLKQRSKYFIPFYYYF